MEPSQITVAVDEGAISGVDIVSIVRVANRARRVTHVELGRDGLATVRDFAGFKSSFTRVNTDVAEFVQLKIVMLRHQERVPNQTHPFHCVSSARVAAKNADKNFILFGSKVKNWDFLRFLI